MLVGVGSPVLVGVELPVVILLFPGLVGVTLMLVRLVEDIVVSGMELLVETVGALVEVLISSVVSVLELVEVPVIVEDVVTTQELPP